jgi:acyl carrier protein
VTLTEDHRHQIQQIISDALEISPEELVPSHRFQEDYDADSLIAIEILAGIEKHLKISIPQNELSRMVNLEGVYAVVESARRAD